eukprot:scpid95174/ scgid13511/ 
MHAHHYILLASYCGAFRSSELVVVWNTAREQHYIGAASKRLILAMSLLPLLPPERLQVYSSVYDAVVRFPTWERRFRLLFAAVGISDATRQRNTFQYVAGKDIQQLVPTLANTCNELDGLISAVVDYFQSKQRPSMAHFHYRQVTHQPGETFDTFYARLLASAQTCSFADDDALKKVALCDHIVAGCTSDPLRRKLLETASLDLDKALKAARALESSVEQATAFRRTHDSVNALRHQPVFHDRTAACCYCFSSVASTNAVFATCSCESVVEPTTCPSRHSCPWPAGFQHIALLPLCRATPPVL